MWEISEDENWLLGKPACIIKHTEFFWGWLTSLFPVKLLSLERNIKISLKQSSAITIDYGFIKYENEDLLFATDIIFCISE